jgi:hypothetical protein
VDDAGEAVFTLVAEEVARSPNGSRKSIRLAG